MKTLKEFEKIEELELEEYLGAKPVEIDEDLCHHISHGYVASNYVGHISDGHYIDQQGEAADSFDDGDSKERYTYMTVASYPDGTHWYLGILPDLNRDIQED